MCAGRPTQAEGGSFPPSPPHHLPASRDPPRVQGTCSACFAHHRAPSCCCLPFVRPVSPWSCIFHRDLESKYYLQLLVRISGHSANSNSLCGQQLPDDQKHPFDLLSTRNKPMALRVSAPSSSPLATGHPASSPVDSVRSDGLFVCPGAIA